MVESFRAVQDFYPGVLHEHFLRAHPDPVSWLNARTVRATNRSID